MSHQLTPPLSESRTASTTSSVYGWATSVVKQLRLPLHRVNEQLRIARLRYASIRKQEFINDIKTAIAGGTGYAAAKIGRSQKHWMYYEILLSKEKNPETVRQFEKYLTLHALNQEGLFPADFDFYLDFNRFYMKHVKNLDCLGLFYDPPSMEMELIKYYRLKNKFIHYPDQEPDRSSPSDDSQCYLRYFRDKRILFICPFAGLLRDRATKEIFEAVWSKTGKKWFYPRDVDAVEFPYGFARETHQQYSTVMDLFEFIMEQIAKKDFDVALIAAGGLSIPIASTIKNMSKVAIDLGGHLQFLFGVIGKRWRDQEECKRDYFNKSWVDMPAKYRPKEIDAGMPQPDAAYW